jgi:hypothetical protein
VRILRARISLAAAVLVASACISSVANAGGPGAVYNDFAADGKLSCNHSRTDLLNVLRSGSLNQYGDPYTLAGLKLAVRRQLAGGCRGGSARSAGPGTATSTTGGPSGGNGTTQHNSAGKPSGKHRASRNPASKGSSGLPPSAQASAGISNGGNGSFVWERVLVAGLLAGGLAIGGWLTRRALTRRN